MLCMKDGQHAQIDFMHLRRSPKPTAEEIHATKPRTSTLVTLRLALCNMKRNVFLLKCLQDLYCHAALTAAGSVCMHVMVDAMAMSRS